MIQFDGIKILVDLLKPNYLSIPVNSSERLHLCECVVLLLNQMISLLKAAKPTFEIPQITRNTLE